MRWTDYDAIVASVITIALVGWGVLALRKPGPQRGFGGAQAAILIVAVMGGAVLHGSIVAGIALAMSRNPVSWTAAGLHALIILASVVRVSTT